MKKSFIVKGIYADGMVLQQNATNCIFGSGKPDSKVELEFRDVNVYTVCDKEGNWKIEYNPGAAGGPFEFILKSDGATVTFKDVYVGEVWLLSGQSNAQLPMQRMKFSYPEEFEQENPNIRMITVPITWSFDGEKDCINQPVWNYACKEQLGGISGTGYFFAKKLQSELGVPVGIVNASQGGSPISAWMDKQSLLDLKNTEAFISQLETYENPENVAKKQAEMAKNQNDWMTLLNDSDKGQKENWQDLPFEKVREAWTDVELPGDIEHENSAGYFWFKKEIVLTAAQVEHFNKYQSWIWMGTIVDADKIWINGVAVGETAYCYPPRRYGIPSGILKEGSNTITMRIMKNSHFGAIRFYTEKPYYIFTDNVKIAPTAIRNVEKFEEVVPSDGEKISLSGTWKMATGACVEDCPAGMFFEWVPTALYNSMLSPCFNYAISGALWYQGEADAWHPDEYRVMLQKMIMLWRQKFKYAKKEMPFVIMQLPNWSDGKGENYLSNELGWAQMRQEQLLVTELMENVGISITIDAGEWNDLHPEKKRTGGTRAALEALRLGYGKKINQSPKAVFTSRRDDAFVIQFDVGSAKLKTLSGSEIPGFYFLYETGNSMKMVEATGQIISDNEVKVPVPAVDGKFAEIRYLWADSPNPINLYSTDDLPVQAFRAVIPE